MGAPVDEAHARCDRKPLAVHFRTLGCKVNRAESEHAAAALLGRGVRLASESEASVVVVNTCTVTAEADRKARKAVRRALAAPQEPMVVVTGCLAALDAPGLEALGERVVVEADRERLAGRVATLLDAPAASAAPAVRVGDGFRVRATVKVQDGCDAFCSYCIVPMARGGPRSVPLPEVLAEVERLVSAGVAEVVLSGINIGRYAWDGYGLPEVVRTVAATGVRRVRISSIEPLDLDEELLATLSATPALCPHVHVPLQSGSDRVLAAMNRRYSAEDYLDRVSGLRAALPHVALTTDVMAGFPGETPADLADALSVIAEVRFARLHVFRYSQREGTRAVGMGPPVPPAEISRRAAVLRDEDARARERWVAQRLGQEAEVLVEEVAHAAAGRVATGTSEDYLRVHVDGTGLNPGSIVRVILEKGCDSRLVGRRAATQPERLA